MPRYTDTIAALATPAGVAAIAVVRASGPDTERLAREIAGVSPPPRLARHLDFRTQGGELLDDVLLTFFKGPHSYTGEDSLEVSCHGSPFIAQQILGDLLARGCRPAEPGEFTQRAFLNGRMDLSQAEAVMDLINARSARALAAANAQLRGALGRRMNAMVETLLDILARIEAYIDFPDEDLPPEDRESIAHELAGLALETDRLLATEHYGQLLRDGIKTVIVGLPNAGKSSLLNRLVGSERALVSPEPGTTRDFIEERIQAGGHCLRIIDTAGLNPSPTPLETLGIQKTLERIAEADLVLLVIDATLPPPRWPRPVMERINAKNSLLVFNKSDLVDGLGRSRSSQTPDIPSVTISALTGAGLEQLVAATSRLAEGFQQEIGSDQIAIGARHVHSLAQARKCLQEAQHKIAKKSSIELIASDLRCVLASYGEIVGKVDNERMLDQLFARFCIGK